LRFALALGDRRGRIAGLGLCLLTGLPDGHGLVLSTPHRACRGARTQAWRCRPGGAATTEEAVNTHSNARFGGEVEWDVNGTMIFLRCSWFEVTLL
jgi:hypothetical protein